MEIATIRLHRWRDSWPSTPELDRDPRHGERVALQERIEPLPTEASPLAPSAKPLEPDAGYRPHQTSKASLIAIHSKVVEVSADPPHERGVLLLNRIVPVAPAVLGERAERSTLARTHGLAPHHPLAPAGLPPVVREPEEVESGRAPSVLPLLGSGEGQKACFLGSSGFSVGKVGGVGSDSEEGQSRARHRTLPVPVGS